MNALIFNLHLLSPLLIAEPGGGDPNSGVGLEYIPGSAIRGALIGRQLRGRAVDALDPTLRRLFLSDKVRFLHGYPLAANGERMLPTPRSWQQPKDAPKEEPAHDWAWGEPNATTQKNWKGVGAPFCCGLGAGGVEQYVPLRQVNIHIAREDRQRPTSGQATIFRYDALAEGQTFGAAILAEATEDLDALRTLLGEDQALHLGHSQSAGYGWVEVRYPTNGASKSAWQEVQPLSATAGTPRQLVVTLLSDALVQDEESGAHVAELTPIVGQRHTQAFARVRMVAGFNRKWNLPLPQTQAVAAGSVFVYPYSVALADRLATLAENGIGGRRNEGFGRIAVNWNVTPKIQFAATAKKAVEVTAPTTLTASARRQASVMVTRMLRGELDRLLLTAINDHPITRRGLRNTQLARLRVVARRAMEPKLRAEAAQKKEIGAMLEFLGYVKEAARQQLQRARVGQEPLLEWLLQLCKQPSRVWTYLQATALPLPTIGDCTAQLTDTLAAEYTLRLIDGMAQMASREGGDE